GQVLQSAGPQGAWGLCPLSGPAVEPSADAVLAPLQSLRLHGGPHPLDRTAPGGARGPVGPACRRAAALPVPGRGPGRVSRPLAPAVLDARPPGQIPPAETGRPPPAARTDARPQAASARPAGRLLPGPATAFRRAIAV